VPDITEENSFVPAVALSLWLLLGTHPQRDLSYADPTSSQSLAGEFRLDVRPNRRTGDRDADCRLTRAGTLVWSHNLPFSIAGAVVAPNGTVGAYAYSRTGDQAFFEVVILRSDGTIARRDRYPRQFSRFIHQPMFPRGTGIFRDASKNRMVVRVTDDERNAG